MERVELRRIDMADMEAEGGVWWGVTAVIVTAVVAMVGDLVTGGTASDAAVDGGTARTKVKHVSECKINLQ